MPSDPPQLPAVNATGRAKRRYRKARNTNSGANPSSTPYQITWVPHWLPSRALTVEASTIAKMAAPGLRTTNIARTPGTSQTPYMNACPGGNALKAGSSATHKVFHAQNTTPNATPSTAVTTRSTVRQPLAAVSARVGLGVLFAHVLPPVDQEGWRRAPVTTTKQRATKS
jgi:hypothetical protein